MDSNHNKLYQKQSYYRYTKGQCGETGIRTPDTVSSMPVFKTGAFNRSAISPFACLSKLSSRFSSLTDWMPYGSELLTPQSGQDLNLYDNISLCIFLVCYLLAIASV